MTKIDYADIPAIIIQSRQKVCESDLVPAEWDEERNAQWIPVKSDLGTGMPETQKPGGRRKVVERVEARWDVVSSA
ncbi:hypothetical protein FKW77_008950 [Venturia effusa]|uniref:Uncharacterized protein n=1 Tax=Venturia effusa TaxID=50376 RepID=A0A517LEG0_9PEZI|nr:hypothetical protein FKW77_008950 [Venturia effusa]